MRFLAYANFPQNQKSHKARTLCTCLHSAILYQNFFFVQQKVCKNIFSSIYAVAALLVQFCTLYQLVRNADLYRNFCDTHIFPCKSIRYVD